MVVNKRKTNRNNNTFTTLDKTQKGGGIWLCSPGAVIYDNINTALTDISSAKKSKLIKLIFNIRDRGSKDWGSWARPGYRCLDKYLEAYYTLTTDIKKQPNVRTVDTDKLIKFGLKKRYRILLGLIYLYLKKNISLDTNKLTAFYQQMTDVQKAITDNTTTTTTTTGPKLTSIQPLDKKAKKQKYYTGVITAANTLLGGKPFANESTLIIEYDNQLKAIKAAQARLEATSYTGMSTTLKLITEAQKDKTIAETQLVESSVANMTAEQIIEMRNKINDGLQKLIQYMNTDNLSDKAIYEARINNYSEQYKNIDPVNDNKAQNKVELKKLEQNVVSLVAIIEKTLDPTDIIKTKTPGIFSRTISRLEYKSLYGIPIAEMTAKTIPELITILNKMDPNTISIDEDLNPNIIQLLNRILTDDLTRLTPATIDGLYKTITIDIRYAILSAIINNDKINQYEDIVINILQSMNEQELAMFERNNPVIPDKLKTILTKITISLLNSNCRALILKTVTPEIIAGLDNNKITQLFTFTLPFVAADIFPSITAYKFIAILNALSIEQINLIDGIVLEVIMDTIGTERNKIIDNTKLAALPALPGLGAAAAGTRTLAARTAAAAAAARTFVDVMTDARAAAAAAVHGAPVNAGPIAFINTLSDAANLPLIINAKPTEITEIALQLYNVGATPAQKAYIKYAAVQAVVRNNTLNTQQIHDAFIKNILPRNTHKPGAYTNDGIPTEDDAMHAAIASGDATAAATRSATAIKADVPAAVGLAVAALVGYTALMYEVYGPGNYTQPFSINLKKYTKSLEFPAWDTIIKQFITAVAGVPSGAEIAAQIITDIAGDDVTFLRGGAKRSRHSKSKRNHKSKKHNTNNKKVSRKHRNVKSKYNSKSKKNNKNTKRRKSKHH